MAWNRANIRIAAAGTVVLVPASAGKTIKVVRWVLNCSVGTLTADLQDTGGTSLTGVASFPLGQTSSAPYADYQDAYTNPILPVTPGLGLQIVSTGTGTMNGWVDYFY